MESISLKGLIAEAKMHRHLKGQLFYSFNDEPFIYMIRSGFVKSYLISKEGKLGIQNIFGPDDIFPLSPLLLKLFNLKLSVSDISYIYEAMVDVTYYPLAVSQVVDAANQNNLIYKDLLREAGKRLTSNYVKLENHAYKSSSEKIAHILIYYAEKFGVKERGNTRIEVPITHQILSEILNLSRETVSREMSLMQHKGWLKPTRRNITITDINAIKELVI